MTNNEPPGNESSSEADVDPGEPIAELSEIEESPSAGFLPRIVRSVERKTLSTDLLELVRRGIQEIFGQYWTMIVSIIKGENSENNKGGRSQ